MFRNYIKIAYRNLFRNKSFTILNITGLLVGMAGAMLIMLWINRELSVDRFHENGEQLYQAWNRDTVDGEVWCWTSTPKPMAPILAQNYPEITEVTRYNGFGKNVFAVGENKISEFSAFVDSTFLQMFTYPLLQGDKQTVLDMPNSVVITESMALKLFGNDNAMGKVVRFENRVELKVTGIMADLPANTDFDFDALLPWSLMVQLGFSDDNWGNNSVSTFVQVEKGIDITSLNKKVATIKKENYTETTTEVFLYPVELGYLYSNFQNGVPVGGNIDRVRMFGLIGLLILIIACINFMNLSTARSEKRAKEVGIRKLSGARKEGLVMQFLIESVCLAIISGILAILLVQLVLPSFNNIINIKLTIPFDQPLFWIFFLSFIAITGILAGSYPAFFLSSFKPVKVLKGTFKKSGSIFAPRKILVIVQFTVAIILIASTIIVKQQIDHVQNRSKGYNDAQLLYHGLNEEIENGFVSFRNELLQNANVSAVTKSMSPITQSWSNSWGIGWEGKDENTKQLIYRFAADIKPVETFEFTLVGGRDIDVTQYATDSMAVILNQEAVKTMGFDEPIGQLIYDGDEPFHVVGVIEDFIIGSPFSKNKPIVIESSASWFSTFHIKLKEGIPMAENLAAIETIFNKNFPDIPFEYEFIDEAFAKNFANQERIATLTTIFSTLAILISCLGLFGLSAYAAEQRSKEIGVRKVLGATVARIMWLLSTDFLKLVIVSLIIATPIAWLMMNNWLQDFDYRISVSALVFITTGIIAILIAVFTVSFQAFKTALINPVDALKDE